MEGASELLEKLEITDSSLNAVSNDFDEEEEIPENLENEFSVVSFVDVYLYIFCILLYILYVGLF